MPVLARLLAFAIAFAAGALPAHAAPVFSEDDVWAGLLAELDTDGNGTVSEDEYAQKADLHTFADLDRNRDGAIDVAELADWVRVTPPRPERSALIGPAGAPASGTPSPEGSPGGLAPGTTTSAAGAPPPPGPPPTQIPTTPQPPTPRPQTPPSAQQAPATTSPTLRWVAAGALGAGGLALLGGLWSRRRSPRRRRRRRR